MQLIELMAIHESLQSLLNRESITEDDCQKWFETNPKVFKILNFVEAIPHPKQICTETEDLHIPDFLVKKINGLWEIFELKRPDTKILKNVKKRKTFYADFNSYVAQCREYSQFYLSSANRKLMEKEYGIENQKSFASTIVAGRDSAVCKKEVHELLFDSGSKVHLLTYDDVLNTILGAVRLQESHLKGLPGITLSQVCSLLEGPQLEKQYFYDFGVSKDKNRISIGVYNSEEFFVKVIDEEGKKQEITIPFSSNDIPVAKAFHLHVEVGLGDNYLYINTFIDGRCITHNILNRANIAPEAFYYWVVGADVQGKTASSMAIAETIIYPYTLSFEERTQLIAYFNDTYSYYLEPEPDSYSLPVQVIFQGDYFLKHKDHPNFSANCNMPTQFPAMNCGPWAWYKANGALVDENGEKVFDKNRRNSCLLVPGHEFVKKRLEKGPTIKLT